MLLLFMVSFLAGVCTMLSPCILPILPIVLASGVSRQKWRPLGVTIGLIVSFTFFTLTLTYLVRAFEISADVLRNIAIGLVFLFGLFMVVPALSSCFYRLLGPVAKIEERIQEQGPQGGFFGGIILGCALGLLWTPCAGPILAAITAFIATQSITGTVVGLILAYVTGAAIPIFLLAWGGGKIVRASKVLSAHAEGIRRFFGWITIFVAVAISFHWDISLEQKISRFVPAITVEDTVGVKEGLESLQKEVAAQNKQPMKVASEPTRYPSYGRAPELTGLTNWINSPALSLNQLQGHVVLIDFWTYSCINCLRTLPHIKELYAQYKDQGLVVIGVHTP